MLDQVSIKIRVMLQDKQKQRSECEIRGGQLMECPKKGALSAPEVGKPGKPVYLSIPKHADLALTECVGKCMGQDHWDKTLWGA